MGRGILLVVGSFAVAAVVATGAALRPRGAGRSDAGPPPAPEVARLVGTVRRAGKPVAARIEARRVNAIEGPDAVRGTVGAGGPPIEPLPQVAARARAGSDGRFFAEVSPGWWVVTAVGADGARGTVAAEARLSGQVVDVTIDVAPGTETLRGRCVRADGRPWSGVVVVESAGRSLHTLPVPLADPVPTSADGRFEVGPLPRGDVRVTPVDPGALRGAAVVTSLPRADDLTLVVDAGFAPVSGLVLDERDAPVGGAEVVLAQNGPEMSDIFVRTTTAPDGTFVASAPGAFASCSASAAGFRRGFAAVWAGQRTVSLHIGRTARIEGCVVQEDGTPVPSVPVIAVSRGGQGARRARSDERGEFALDDVPAADLLVFALGGGWASDGLSDVRDEGPDPLLVRVVAGSTTRVERRVVPAARVEGVVVDAKGRPVAGALVRATAESRPFDRIRLGNVQGAERISGSDGRASFDTLVPGFAYRIEATAPGSGAGATAAALAPRPGQVVSFRVQLAPPRTLAVRVTDERTHAPVADAWVAVFQGPAKPVKHSSLAPPIASGTTDAEGSAWFSDLPPGLLSVWATASETGESPGPDPKLEVTGSAEGALQMTAIFETEPVGSIAGTVRFEDGAPAPGAVVSTDEGSAVCDPLGAFVLRRVPEGLRQLHAHIRHASGRFEGSIHVATGAAEAGLVLQRALESGRPESEESLLVRLVGEDDAPVFAAEARLRGRAETRGFLVEGGTARVPRAAGSTLEVWSPRRSDGSLLPWGAVVFPLTSLEDEVVVKMPPEWRITGRVVDADRRGVGGVEVSAVPDVSSRAERGAPAHAVARSGPDGAYALGNLADRPYRLEVTRDAFLPTDSEAPRVSGGTGNVEIRVRAAARPRIEVLDPDGNPVSGATVFLVSSRSEFAFPRGRILDQDQTDALGRIRLRGLIPDVPHRLFLRPPVGRDDLLAKTLAKWMPADDTIRLDRGLVVSGVVVDTTGHPIAGARVNRAGSGRDAAATVVTDDAGRFRFGSLSPGSVTLRMEQALHVRSSASDDVVVAAGTENVVLRGEAGAVLVLSLARESSERGEEDAVFLDVTREDDGRRMARFEPHALGVVRVAGLDPQATYAVWARAASGPSAYLRGAHPGTEPIPMRLTQGRSITGRVHAPADFTKLMVSASGVGLSQIGRVFEDGTFRIEHLPEGTWTVLAVASGTSDLLDASAEVAAGGEAILTIERK